jgi:hypothetical protein
MQMRSEVFRSVLQKYVISQGYDFQETTGKT